MAKKKIKPKKTRNWQAVDAQFRTSAGPMQDRRKEVKSDWATEWLDELAKEDNRDGNDQRRNGGSDLCDEDL